MESNVGHPGRHLRQQCLEEAHSDRDVRAVIWELLEQFDELPIDHQRQAYEDTLFVMFGAMRLLTKNDPVYSAEFRTEGDDSPADTPE